MGWSARLGGAGVLNLKLKMVGYDKAQKERREMHEAGHNSWQIHN